MTRYADPTRCPDCAQPIEYAAAACRSCGLPLRGATAQRLFQVLSTADDLLASLRSSVAPVPAAVPAEGAPQAPAAGVAATVLPPVRGGLSAASVPKILLGLGAVCLLIAALVFLAVTWQVMGVGGRTATLVGFTAVTGALAAWMARRDLRGAAEALSLVSLGLLTLDTFGAREAGWFGEVSTAWFMVLLGAVLATTGAAASLAARRTAAGGLTGADVVAGLGVGVLSFGVGDVGRPSTAVALVLAVLVAGGGAYLALRLGLVFTASLAGAAAALSWVGLFLTGLEAADPATLHGMWLELDAWQLLACAALVGVVALVRELPMPGRVGAAAVAYGVLTLTVVLPGLDDSATATVVVSLAALAAAGVVSWFLPRPWAFSTALTQAVAGLVTLAALVGVGVFALTRLGSAASAQWTGSTGGRLVGAVPTELPAPWLAPLCLVALLATALAVARAAAVSGRDVVALADPGLAAVLLVVSGLATLSSYPVPVWTVLVALIVAAVGLLGWWRAGQSPVPLVLAAVFAAGAVILGWYDEWLSVAALTAVVLMAGVVHLRARQTDTSAVAGALAMTAVSGSAWTWGALVEASQPWVAVAGLALLSVVVLALHLYPEEWWACDASVTARAGVEVGAAVAALPLALAGVLLAAPSTQATWTAVYLTVSGAAVTALALVRADRRQVAWLGGALLALASWVRLWDIGVNEPEPYTLPTALVLLTLGVLHLRRHPEASTLPALGGGLGLALVPSLLWVLADPDGLRALLLGLACLALVVVGLGLRWTAPVAVGALVGGLEVFRLAAPYIGDAVPRWLLIGTAGALLIGMGVTWERRLQEARQVMGYVRGLR